MILEAMDKAGINQVITYDGDCITVPGIKIFTANKNAIAEQADVIYSQIASIAAEENTDLSNLVKVTIYITSFDDLESLRATLFKHYGSTLPASSLVQVKRLFSPDLKIEVEAILALN